LNDAEFRRRAHALLMRLGHVGGCVECGLPPFAFRGYGVPEPCAEVAALREAGPQSDEPRGDVLAVVPYVCPCCGVGATMDMETMNCAVCGCALRRATALEADCGGVKPPPGSFTTTGRATRPVTIAAPKGPRPPHPGDPGVAVAPTMGAFPYSTGERCACVARGISAAFLHCRCCGADRVGHDGPCCRIETDPARPSRPPEGGAS
jgi:hypothetical protein